MFLGSPKFLWRAVRATEILQAGISLFERQRELAFPANTSRIRRKSFRSSATAPALLYLLHPCSRAHAPM